MDEVDFVFACQQGVSIAAAWKDIRLGDFNAKNAPLTGHSLEGCFFRDCDFSEADFDLCLFKHVTFISCFLDGASLESASFENVTFYDCSLSGASFGGAEMKEVEFHRCTGPVDLSFADLTGARIKESDFSGSDLHNTALDWACLTRVVLEGSLLNRGTSVKGTVFRLCNVTELPLENTKGYEPGSLEGCFYMPYLTSDSGLYQTQNALKASASAAFGPPRPPADNDRGRPNLSIYKGVELRAVLSCSSLEEYNQCL